MRMRHGFAAVMACGVLAASASAQEVTQAIRTAAEQTKDAIVTVRFTLREDMGNRTISGPAVCVDAKGVFATIVIDTRLGPGDVEKVEVFAPGITSEAITAKVLGTNPSAGITFVQAAGGSWQTVNFAEESSLTLGQMVVSVGMLSGDTGNLPYYGVAYVSTLLRVPENLVYVTGGQLTGVGSPVFTADGRAIGLVGRQLPLNYSVMTNRGAMPMRLQGEQQTSFFVPVEEWGGALKEIPAEGKSPRLSWLGVVDAAPVDEEELAKLGLQIPAVRILRVIPGSPAAKAGLADGDLLVGLNGSPLKELATPEMTMRDTLRTLGRMKVGQKVILTVLRDGKRVDVSATLEPLPVQPYEAPRYYSKPLGFVVRERVPLDRYLNPALPADVPGLIVVLVQPQSPAAQGRLNAGDLITTVNDQPVEKASTLEQIVQAALVDAPDKPVNLLVQRGGQPRAVSIMPPQANP